MSHWRGKGKQVGVWGPARVARLQAVAPQKQPNRLGQVVEIDLVGPEIPDDSLLDQRVFRSGRRPVVALECQGAVSHGRVLSTPTTRSALRSTRCLAAVPTSDSSGVVIYIRSGSEKCPDLRARN